MGQKFVIQRQKGVDKLVKSLILDTFVKEEIKNPLLFASQSSDLITKNELLKQNRLLQFSVRSQLSF